jgi:hypothetical protein
VTKKWKGLTPDNMPGQGVVQRERRFEVLRCLTDRPATTRKVAELWRSRAGGPARCEVQVSRDLSNVRGDLCALRHRGFAVKIPRDCVVLVDRWVLGAAVGT